MPLEDHVAHQPFRCDDLGEQVSLVGLNDPGEVIEVLPGHRGCQRVDHHDRGLFIQLVRNSMEGRGDAKLFLG